MDGNIVMILAVITLSAGLLFGIWSFTRAKRAQDHHEGAAVERRMRNEPPAPVPPEKMNNPPRPAAPPD